MNTFNFEEVTRQATYNFLRTEILESSGRAMTHYEIKKTLKLSDGKAEIYRAAFDLENGYEQL